jgi:hypothetical protein
MKARIEPASGQIHLQKLGWVISYLVAAIAAELTNDGILPSNMKCKE